MGRNMKTLKKIGIVFSIIFFFSANANAETLRIAGNFATDHSSSVAMKKFSDEVSKLTNGKLKVDVFPAMQLGGAKENIDQVRSGAVAMTWVGMAYLGRTVPELEAVSLPFVFKDRNQAFKVIDGKVGSLLNKKLESKGFTTLGYMELGSRNVTNNKRPLKTLDDFKDLKIRLQPNEVHLSSFRAIGANPVSMGIKEVYSALQQGVLDGQENPYSIIATRKFNEVQKYLSDTGHFFDFIIVVANKNKFEKLSPEYKKAIQTAMKNAVNWQRKQAATEDEASKAKLIKAGMKYDSISPQVRAQLIDKTKNVVVELKKRIGSDVVDAVLESTK
jgi:tripartite ATP-independent transporter DctP family solute receptor